MWTRRRLLALLSLTPIPALFHRTTPTEPWVRDHPPPIDYRTPKGLETIRWIEQETYVAYAYFRRGDEWCVRQTKPHKVGKRRKIGPDEWEGPSTYYLPYGPGTGVDPMTLAKNSRRYPAREFPVESPPDPRTEPKCEIRITCEAGVPQVRQKQDEPPDLIEVEDSGMNPGSNCPWHRTTRYRPSGRVWNTTLHNVGNRFLLPPPPPCPVKQSLYDQILSIVAWSNRRAP
jgi:hypothetical protein